MEDQIVFKRKSMDLIMDDLYIKKKNLEKPVDGIRDFLIFSIEKHIDAIRGINFCANPP